jgi:hypothetical protein
VDHSVVMLFNKVRWFAASIVFNEVIFVHSGDQSLLEESTVMICKNFVVNNCQTGNFGSLVRVFLTRANELQMAAQCNELVF